MRSVSSRARALAATTFVAGAVAKIVTVVAAIRIVAGDVRGAIVVSVVGGAFYAVRRVVAGSARIAVECDLHRLVANRILEGDVLEVQGTNTLHRALESTYEASRLLSDSAPELAGDVVAFAAVAPFVGAMIPARALAVFAVAAVALLAAVLLVRRSVRGFDERSWDAQNEATKRMSYVIEGALEIVARGLEREATDALDDALNRFSHAARRASLASGLLGRAALAAGLVAAVAAVLVDETSRAAVSTALLQDALVLAAVMPIVFGAVSATMASSRAFARSAVLVELVRRPARADVRGGGEACPALPAAIEARGLAFAYASGTSRVLDGVGFTWTPGRMLVVAGPNGSGKSTILRLLVALRAPDRGDIFVGGRNLAELDARAFRERVAYLPQRPWLGAPSATVREAIALLAPAAPEDAMRETIARVGLNVEQDVLDSVVGELSAGQRQRVALARVLLCDAPIVLLDEPDANLDREGVQMVAEIVKGLVRDGKMVAVAAHGEELRSLEGLRVELSVPRRAGTPA